MPVVFKNNFSLKLSWNLPIDWKFIMNRFIDQQCETKQNSIAQNYMVHVEYIKIVYQLGLRM